jgi:hypothetical protein
LVNFQQRLSDLVSPYPSDDELVVFLKEATEFKGELSGLQQEIWRFLDERGCLTPKTLRWVEENVPDFADEAVRLLQLKMAEEEQAELGLELTGS